MPPARDVNPCIGWNRVPERTDITFPSGDGRCAGWLYPAASSDAPGSGTSVPCVVMAHGFACQKEGRLDAFAERFADAGMAVLVFDYRNFGLSSTETERLVDIGIQHTDWQAAIEHARSLEGIDPERIGIWGSSFSGGHVMWAAARDARLKAAVAQVPHASGTATLLQTGPVRLSKMTAAALQDQAMALIGRKHEVPIVGPEGTAAVMTTDGADTAYPDMYPDDFHFVNKTPARVVLRISAYSPGRDAGKITCPLMVFVGDQDTITPPGPARSAAERAPKGELISFDGRHFDIYQGETFEWAVKLESEFLSRNLA